MNSDRRPYIRRRRHAFGRLRSLSTAAAVAGVAGTAGFGVVAAISWAGEPEATPLPATTDDGGLSGGGSTRQQPQSGTQGGAFARPPAVSSPRPGRGSSGGGHASTGGSH